VLACGVGCHREREAPKQPENAPPVAAQAPGVPRHPGERVIDVVFDGLRIQMVGALRPGEARFVFHNSTRGEHSFVVVGEGKRTQLQDPVPAGRSGEMVVDLPPGTFKVYCSLPGHRAEPGRQFVVTPRASY
jgi:hypothetical protein